MTMKNLLRGSRRRLAVGSVLALAAAMILPMSISYAAFSSTTSSPGSSWTANSGFGCFTTLPIANPTLFWSFSEVSGNAVYGSDTGGQGGKITAATVSRVPGSCTDSPYLHVGGNVGTPSVVADNRVSAPQVFTLSVWLRTDAGNNSGGGIMGFSSDPTTYLPGSNDRFLFADSDGYVNFRALGGFTLTSKTKINDGKWHHVVALMNPQRWTSIWIDGQQSNWAQTSSLPPIYDGSWVVGLQRLDSDPTRVKGWIFVGDYDDVAVYPRELSPTEITSLYQAGRV
jgi:large repetitive protein